MVVLIFIDRLLNVLNIYKMIIADGVEFVREKLAGNLIQNEFICP